MTQKENVLQLLNQAEWVCGIRFQQEYIPEYRSRINELRKDKFTIEARRCTQHQHKGMMQEWSLRPKDEESTVPEKSPLSVANLSSQAKPQKTVPHETYVPVCCNIYQVTKTMHTRGCAKGTI